MKRIQVYNICCDTQYDEMMNDGLLTSGGWDFSSTKSSFIINSTRQGSITTFPPNVCVHFQKWRIKTTKQRECLVTPVRRRVSILLVKRKDDKSLMDVI